MLKVNKEIVGIYDNTNTPVRSTHNGDSLKDKNVKGIVRIEELASYCRNRVDLKTHQELYNSLEGEEKKSFKTNNLQCFTPSGVLDSKRKNIKSLVWDFTGIVFGDIDKLEGYSMDAIKKVLIADNNIFWVKKSCSEKGFHFFFKISGGLEFYKPALLSKYSELYKSLGWEFDIKIFDRAVNNWNRQCYVSYDAASYFQLNKSEYDCSNLIPDTGYNLNIKEVSETDISSLIISENFTQEQTNEFTNFLIKKKLSWSSGNRSKFLSSIHYIIDGISDLKIEDVIGLSFWFINSDYTDTYTEEYIKSQILKCYQNYNPNQKYSDDTPSTLFGEYEEIAEETTGYEDVFFESYAKGSCWNVNVTELKYNEYITDNSFTFNVVKSKLEKYSNLLIVSETGSGKTTLIYDYVEKFNIKADFIFPTRVLAQQQKCKQIVGSDKNIHFNELIVASTYDNINKLQSRKSELLIIDEAHMFVTEYAFRNTAIENVKKLLSNYKYVLWLTGTPEPLLNIFTNNKLTFISDKVDNTTYNIVKQNARRLEVKFDKIMKLEKAGLNVYYKDNKDELAKFKTILETKGKKVIIINSELKDTEEYKFLVESQSLKTCDWFLTTRVIREGVNILDKFENVNIVFGTGVDTVTLKQFKARFRNADAITVNLLHNYNDRKLFFNRKLFNISVQNFFKIQTEMQARLNDVKTDKREKTNLDLLLTKASPIIMKGEEPRINKLYILSYNWIYEALHQSNNLDYMISKIGSPVNRIEIQDVKPEKVMDIKKANTLYNKNKIQNKQNYVKEILKSGLLENDSVLWKKEINERYCKLLTYITIKELRKKEGLENDSLLTCSNHKYYSFINKCKYFRNVHILNNYNLNEHNLSEFQQMIQVQELQAELIKNAQGFKRDELEKMIVDRGLIGVRIEDLHGVQFDYKTFRIGNETEKRYVFTTFNLKDFISDYSRLYSDIDVQYDNFFE